jgi:hypothetical protein
MSLREQRGNLPMHADSQLRTGNRELSINRLPATDYLQLTQSHHRDTEDAETEGCENLKNYVSRNNAKIAKG